MSLGMTLFMGCVSGGLGLALGLYLGRERLLRAVEAASLQGESSRAVLIERLRGREAELAEVQDACEELEERLAQSQEDRGRLEVRLASQLATSVEERRAMEEKLSLLTHARHELTHAFQALSAEALRTSSASFLELARTQLERFQESARTDLTQRQESIELLVQPLRVSLEKVDVQVSVLEKARAEAQGGLNEQLKSLTLSQDSLKAETARLASALRSPTVRGRWGELQLKRVVELSGMLECCDFEQQVSVQGEKGTLRPDMVVRLPGGRQVVVDAKAPLAAYLEALESHDEERRVLKLKEHAQALRNHLRALGEKAYWSQFEGAPEFVVMFLPGETFFGAALEQDPSLIEAGVDKQVLLATPTTLIALLRSVAVGWRQEKVTENAQEIRELGKSLYERLRSLGTHFAELGRSLDRSVGAYNNAVGNLEGRVLPAARRFQELGAAGEQALAVLPPVESLARRLRAPELESAESAEPVPLDLARQNSRTA